jgi:hypothetical protein
MERSGSQFVRVSMSESPRKCNYLLRFRVLGTRCKETKLLQCRLQDLYAGGKLRKRVEGRRTFSRRPVHPEPMENQSVRVIHLASSMAASYS